MKQSSQASANKVLAYCHTRDWGKNAILRYGPCVWNEPNSWFVSAIIINRGTPNEKAVAIHATMDAVRELEAR